MRFFIRFILGVAILIGIFVTTFLVINKIEVNSPKRDIIEFKDSVEVVQTTIKDLVSLLNKTSSPNGQNYYFSSGNLYINSVKIEKQKSFTIKEKEFFEELTNKLKRNFISGAYQDRFTGIWLFDYRKLWDPSFFDTRSVAYLRKIQDTILLTPENNILDMKQNLFLLAPNGNHR